MNLAFRVAKNTFYQILGKSFGAIIGLATVALMTRYLGQTGYGYYTTIIAFLQFFGVMTDFGLQMTTTKILSEPGADERKIFGNIFVLRIASSIIFLGSAVVLVWLLPYPLIIKQGIALASGSFLFISLQSIFISIFQKHLRMARVAIADVWSRGITLLGVWLAVQGNLDLLAIIGAIVVGHFTSLSLLFTYSRQYLKLRPAIDWVIWRRVFTAAWPLAVTIALTLVYFRADTIILALVRPANEVGIYGATYRVLEVLIQFPYLFLGLLLPLLTKFFISNRRLFELTIQKTLDLMLIITVPMALALALLGEQVMVFVAGPEFIVSGTLLKILVFAVVLIYFGALFGYAIVAAELQKKMIKFYLLDAVISLPLYLWLIPLYSYWAAAWLTIFTEAIITLAAFYILRKYTHLRLQAKILAKVLGAGLIMAGVIWLLREQNVIVLVIIGLIVYLWALYLLKGVTKTTIMELANIKH